MKNHKDIRIWIVEDSVGYRRAVVRAVNSMDNLVCERQFTSAERLLEVLSSQTGPDVLLMDFQLPGMDGISALSSVRQKAAATRTIILTVFDDSEKIYRAICSGASGYLLKSAGIREISSAILDVVSGGAPMTPSVATKVLRFFSAVNVNPPKVDIHAYHLTEREKEILRLMTDGLIKKEIADALQISLHTVNTHIRSIYEKLHVHTNTGAVAKAIREDIV